MPNEDILEGLIIKKGGVQKATQMQASTDILDGLIINDEPVTQQKAKQIDPQDMRLEDISEDMDLPEFDLPREETFSWPGFKTSAGLMATFDPDRQIDIIKANFPQMRIKPTEDNYIIDARAYGGDVSILNKKGISTKEVLPMAGQAALFTPAGRLAGKTMLGTMGKVAAGSAATQAGIDVAGQATYQTPSVEDISKIDVAFSAAGGAAFEPLSRLVGRFLPVWKMRKGITEKMRTAFREAARESGNDPQMMTDEVIASYMQKGEKATKGAISEGYAKEFGIRQTAGQRTADPTQLDIEDTLRHTTVSPRARARMETFGEAQRSDIGQATSRTQARLGGQRIDTPEEAADLAGESVQAKGDILFEDVGRAYSDVGEAKIKKEGMQAVADKLGEVTRSATFIKDQTLVPSTSKALSYIKKQKKFLKFKRLKDADFRAMEIFRRKLLAYKSTAANSTDIKQMNQVVKAFDEGLRDAVDQALISGDEKVLDQLLKARGLRADYGRLFQANDIRTRGGRKVADTAGDFVEKMMAKAPSPEEISNALYGATKLGSKKGSLELARKFKTILGEGSNEWNAVRQGAFLKLFEKTPEGFSGRKILTRLRAANQSYMRELFSTEEIALMNRLGQAIKSVQPEPGNPPKTAHKIFNIINQMMQTLLPSLGFQVGGLAGAAAGSGAASIAGWRQALAAARATSEPARRVVIPVGQVAAVSARKREIEPEE